MIDEKCNGCHEIRLLNFSRKHKAWLCVDCTALSVKALLEKSPGMK